MNIHLFIWYYVFYQMIDLLKHFDLNCVVQLLSSSMVVEQQRTVPYFGCNHVPVHEPLCTAFHYADVYPLDPCGHCDGLLMLVGQVFDKMF